MTTDGLQLSHAAPLRPHRSLVPGRRATCPSGTDGPEWDESPCRPAAQTSGSGPSSLQCHGWGKHLPSATAHHLERVIMLCNETIKKTWRQLRNVWETILRSHHWKIILHNVFNLVYPSFSLSSFTLHTWVSDVVRHHIFGLDRGVAPAHQMQPLHGVLLNHTAGWEDIKAVKRCPGIALYQTHVMR